MQQICLKKKWLKNQNDHTKKKKRRLKKTYDRGIGALIVSSARTKMEVLFRVKNRLNGMILHSANFLFVIASGDVFMQFLIQATFKENEQQQ